MMFGVNPNRMRSLTKGSICQSHQCFRDMLKILEVCRDVRYSGGCIFLFLRAIKKAIIEIPKTVFKMTIGKRDIQTGSLMSRFQCLKKYGVSRRGTRLRQRLRRDCLAFLSQTKKIRPGLERPSRTKYNLPTTSRIRSYKQTYL